MIKTYQENFTLSAPLYHETDELWSLSTGGDPNWYCLGSVAIGWESGKGVGDIGTHDLIFLPLQSACTPIDCICTCIIENSTGGVYNTFGASLYFEFDGLVFDFGIKHGGDNKVFSRVRISTNGLTNVVSEWMEMSNGSAVFRIFDDVTHYIAVINGSNAASIAKTENNYPGQHEIEHTGGTFRFSCSNTEEDLKFYLSSIDFEYDEFVSNPFWTDLINCHETT